VFSCTKEKMRTEEITENQKIICNDCVTEMATMPAESVDVVITSPPYNIKYDYYSYKDDAGYEEYFEWMRTTFAQIERVLKPDGSFFLNAGGNCKQPWNPMELGFAAGQYMTLQNNIVWIKSISTNDKNYGHIRPMHGDRFLHQQHESIFHFTKHGNLKLDRLAIGVPYTDKWNLTRRTKKKDNVRCRGNAWYIPYETIHKKKAHGAAFPVALPEQCILLHGLRSDLIVLDPFLGGGTTLLACKKLGLHGIGIELDPYYCQLSKENLEFKPILISIDNKIFENLDEASKETGISKQTINNRLRNENFSNYKLIF